MLSKCCALFIVILVSIALFNLQFLPSVHAVSSGIMEIDSAGFAFGWSSAAGDTWLVDSAIVMLNEQGLVQSSSTAINGDAGAAQQDLSLIYLNNVGFSFGWSNNIGEAYRPSNSMLVGTAQLFNNKAPAQPPSAPISGDAGSAQQNPALIYLNNVGFSFGWGVAISDVYRTSTSMTVSPPIALNHNGLKPGSGVGGFELVSTPATRTVQIGDSVTYKISLAPLEGFSSEVTLGVTGAPSGTTAKFAPPKIVPGETSILTISTSTATPPATTTLTITGTTPEITRQKNIELNSILALEIALEKYYTKVDVSKLHFEIVVNGHSYVAPTMDGEMATSKAFVIYPGPLYIPVDTKPSFPLQIKVNVFSRNPDGTEVNIGTTTHSISSIGSLPSTAEFDLSNICFKLNVRALNAERIPDKYFPDGTNELGTPYLMNEWYWFSVGADKVFANFHDSDFAKTTVAVLDTGVDYNHPALDDVIWINNGEIGLDFLGRDKRTNGWDDDGNGYFDDWHGWDSVGLNDGDPMDEGNPKGEFHGTEVAGVLAAQAQTGFTAGVAAAMRGRIQIMPVRVLSNIYQPFQYVDIAEGIDYAVKNGANVISMSFGKYEDYPLNVVQEAIQRAIQQGVVVVAAVGNEKSMGAFFPAYYEQVISVSGVRRVNGDDEYVGFWGEFEGGSNYGPETVFAGGKSVEISAPAEKIWTINRGSDFSVDDGTSFSAPIVSATCAMVLGYASQKYGQVLTVAQVRSILRDSTVDLGVAGWDPYYGFGVVNAFAALQKVDELLGNIPTLARLVVRGNNNWIYYRTYGSEEHSWTNWDYSGGQSWTDWASLPSGSTQDGPASVFFGDELHFVVRGMSGDQLWHSYVNLVGGGFSGWTLLSGSTPSIPTLTANSTHLCLVVRGQNNLIYYRFYDVSARVWTGWAPLPSGATCDSPAAAILGNKLHVVVRGMDGYTLWHSSVDLSTGVFSGWDLVGGASESKPTLATCESRNEIILVVKGLNNVIYRNSWTGSGWIGWSGLPTGSTCDGVGATAIGETLHVVVRGMDGNKLWHGNVNLETGAFSGWTLLDGSTPSAPTLTS